MLCSVRAGKAGPNWLDRLRSNKGFPITDNLELDHFLTDQNLDNPCSLSDSNPHSTRADPHSDANLNSQHQDNSSSNSPIENGNPSSFEIITDILSDLFNMGGASRNSKCCSKKYPRKQSNPKICSIPSIANVDYADAKNLCCLQKEDNILSSNSDNSSKGCTDSGSDMAQNVCLKVVEEEVWDEKCEKELKGYSKSEVTVIDTSDDVWKSDKLIFRRKSVWKVKDKKCKLRSYGRKKRKQSSEMNDLPDRIVSASKKTKVWGSEERFHLNKQQIHGKESLKPLNKVHNLQHCYGPEIRLTAPDSSNEKKENGCTLSQKNGGYDPKRKWLDGKLISL
ncbi:hypothetical protein IC575_022515 [Cucumis melo]|uniref:Uncharacterized protein LOC103482569 n=1 Tax=Cucumis melo TaxID=3656 RepID=A0ABM3L6U7_CUCME|nr:uncharacterized protein LOC103482569 [Cucumis melo]XP_050945767.1 uncharacterized protein LOC103482569 [Cucumis melo]